MLKMILIGLTLVIPSVPVLAGGRAPASAAIAHSDLDLATPAGRAALDARIRAKASQVCRREAKWSGWDYMGMNSCIVRAISGARQSAARAIAESMPAAHPVGTGASR